ncbi:PIN domain-containing protein [Porphyromonas vaginalis]|uniref:PIN domain-containing protein n=1 Tax=Porphyromonas vaginalis TaxID=3044325 RepID=UPI0026201494|nr:PIN domain-containing protein [Porphyromonas vaginalis]
MTDNIKLSNYKSFFADQVKEAIEEQQKINRLQMRDLFKKGELSLAYVDSIQSETGMIILKCPHCMAPRLKVQKGVCIIKKGAKQALGVHVTEWTCRWEEFVSNKDFHSPGSDMTPMYYMHTGDPDYDYVACSGFSFKLYDILSKALADGKSLSLIVHNPFPPVEYYRDLSNYIDAFSSNKELNLEPTINYEEWDPEELAFDEQKPTSISDTIIDTLANEHCCIVQGPPGTGKSYTIASIISSYLDASKAVCVTTMANKGLIELIKQKPLQKHVKQGRVSKTNLSIDERKQVPGIKEATADLQVPRGELLCATNYQLASVYSEKKKALYGLPQYDLVVIEEASQAFLTTIVAFKQLGINCLIVGDPMQLPPIVKLNNPQYNSWNISTQVEGLKTVALGSQITSYRIITTFRLTSRSATLTKLFYGNRFVSVKKEYLDFSDANSPLFPTRGGVIYHCTFDARNGVYSDKANLIIQSVIDTMESHYPTRSLAIITPFRESVKELQKRFCTSDIELDITIETIDRIQGMTVDYAVFYIPGRNPGFALEDRRFNVATSRSLSTTLIISDIPLHEFHTVSPTVLQFIDNCDKYDGGIKVIPNNKIEATQITEPSQTMEETTKSEVSTPTIGVKVVGKIDLSKFERTKKELSSNKKNYYIIDTNVFVNCPDIISKIDKKYPIILSAKVTDELDKMKIKLSDEGKRNAEKALRNLNNETQHEIIYEFANTALLPEDFDKRSPDNMIISVALKYKDQNPIMLTSDNGLQLKSKILGFKTLSLKSFLRQ